MVLMNEFAESSELLLAKIVSPATPQIELDKMKLACKISLSRVAIWHNG